LLEYFKLSHLFIEQGMGTYTKRRRCYGVETCPYLDVSVKSMSIN